MTESGLVDVAVEPHTGQTAEDGADQRDDNRGDQGDDAAGGQGSFVDRDPGEAVEVAENVVLAAEYRSGD